MGGGKAYILSYIAFPLFVLSGVKRRRTTAPVLSTIAQLSEWRVNADDDDDRDGGGGGDVGAGADWLSERAGESASSSVIIIIITICGIGACASP